jgi:hypothetical protein
MKDQGIGARPGWDGSRREIDWFRHGSVYYSGDR